MTDRPRKTFQELQAEARGDMPSPTMAGRQAAVCPYCGCAMFAKKKMPQETAMIYRYEHCRNCDKTFYTRAPSPPPREIVREVGNKDSSPGNEQLTVYRETA